MIRHKTMLSFKVFLAVAVLCLATPLEADNICLWCNKRLTRIFMSCVMQKVSKNFNVDGISMIQMKNGIVAASNAMNVPEPVKDTTMTGAFTFAFSKLISQFANDQNIEGILSILQQCHQKVGINPDITFYEEVVAAIKLMQAQNPNTPTTQQSTDQTQLDDISAAGQNDNSPSQNNNAPQQPASITDVDDDNLNSNQSGNQKDELSPDNQRLPQYDIVQQQIQQQQPNAGVDNFSSNQGGIQQKNFPLNNQQPLQYGNIPQDQSGLYGNANSNQSPVNNQLNRYSFYNQQSQRFNQVSGLNQQDSQQYNNQQPSQNVNIPQDQKDFSGANVNSNQVKGNNPLDRYLLYNQQPQNILPYLISNQGSANAFAVGGTNSRDTSDQVNQQPNSQYNNQQASQNVNNPQDQKDFSAFNANNNQGQGNNQLNRNLLYNEQPQNILQYSSSNQGGGNTFAPSVANPFFLNPQQQQPLTSLSVNNQRNAFQYPDSFLNNAQYGDGGASAPAVSNPYNGQQNYNGNIQPYPNSYNQGQTPNIITPGNNPQSDPKQQIAPTTSFDKTANSMKFAETLYVILSKALPFLKVFHANTKNSEVISILPFMIYDGLSSYGYSESLAQEMAQDSVPFMSAFPEGSSTSDYAEAICKMIMVQFNRKNLVEDDPNRQGQILGNCFIDSLEKIENQSPLQEPSDSSAIKQNIPITNNDPTTNNNPTTNNDDNGNDDGFDNDDIDDDDDEDDDDDDDYYDYDDDDDDDDEDFGDDDDSDSGDDAGSNNSNFKSGDGDDIDPANYLGLPQNQQLPETLSTVNRLPQTLPYILQLLPQNLPFANQQLPQALPSANQQLPQTLPLANQQQPQALPSANQQPYYIADDEGNSNLPGNGQESINVPSIEPKKSLDNDFGQNSADQSDVTGYDPIAFPPNIPYDSQTPDSTKNTNLPNVTESKNRLKIIMKLISDCMAKNNFDYKSFSNGIAEIVKSVGDEHPDWKDRKSQTLALIEIIYGLTLSLRNQNAKCATQQPQQIVNPVQISPLNQANYQNAPQIDQNPTYPLQQINGNSQSALQDKSAYQPNVGPINTNITPQQALGNVPQNVQNADNQAAQQGNPNYVPQTDNTAAPNIVRNTDNPLQQNNPNYAPQIDNNAPQNFNRNGNQAFEINPNYAAQTGNIAAQNINMKNGNQALQNNQNYATQINQNVAQNTDWNINQARPNFLNFVPQVGNNAAQNINMNNDNQAQPNIPNSVPQLDRNAAQNSNLNVDKILKSIPNYISQGANNAAQNNYMNNGYQALQNNPNFVPEININPVQNIQDNLALQNNPNPGPPMNINPAQNIGVNPAWQNNPNPAPPINYNAGQNNNWNNPNPVQETNIAPQNNNMGFGNPGFQGNPNPDFVQNGFPGNLPFSQQPRVDFQNFAQNVNQAQPFQQNPLQPRWPGF